MIERRRAERLPCSLQIEVKRGGTWTCYDALDPSHRGLFVRLQEAFLPNQLIQLRVFVGPHQAPLEMLARVVRQTTAAEVAGSDEPAGTALEFFSLKGETLQRWLQFLNLARKLLTKEQGARGLARDQHTGWSPGVVGARGLAPTVAGDALSA